MKSTNNYLMLATMTLAFSSVACANLDEGDTVATDEAASVTALDSASDFNHPTAQRVAIDSIDLGSDSRDLLAGPQRAIFDANQPDNYRIGGERPFQVPAPVEVEPGDDFVICNFSLDPGALTYDTDGERVTYVAHELAADCDVEPGVSLYVSMESGSATLRVEFSENPDIELGFENVANTFEENGGVTHQTEGAAWSDGRESGAAVFIATVDADGILTGTLKLELNEYFMSKL
ncbi:MAG: hypothetical protein AAGA56_03530 [Myxococcota bacterium]